MFSKSGSHWEGGEAFPVCHRIVQLVWLEKRIPKNIDASAARPHGQHSSSATLPVFGAPSGVGTPSLPWAAFPTLAAKKFPLKPNLNVPWCNLRPFSLVLSQFPHR
ncbi:hypothetical protein Nmel_018571 [Mimus melanotis]